MNKWQKEDLKVTVRSEKEVTEDGKEESSSDTRITESLCTSLCSAKHKSYASRQHNEKFDDKGVNGGKEEKRKRQYIPTKRRTV